MIMFAYLYGFLVHINVVLCNDIEKIYLGISGKYDIIIKIFDHENSYIIAYITAILLHIII